LIKEEKILRQQKSRLEARMAILEDHNRQLEAQLDRLRQLLATETGLNGNTARENGTNGTLQSRSHLASRDAAFSFLALFRSPLSFSPEVQRCGIGSGKIKSNTRDLDPQQHNFRIETGVRVV
jgi:hypothetical protein